ncbi:uncharacterized protein [Choristoneura fumiferana]|uniref:uncharacterized protein n=1 Tax=Choristoneura fumiferana TaxID=7141 RepID=UPI003D157240
MDWCFIASLSLLILSSLVSARTRYRKPLIHYPKDTQFWVSDFFVYGCANFLTQCPQSYKEQSVCARSYKGEYRNFANYCEMQYENCNTWRNWRIFKREFC